MHLIICNERLLFRFGVDRVLLLLARELKAAGWHITFIAQRADPEVLRGISDDIHVPPANVTPYTELDRVTGHWLRENRHRLMPKAEHGRTIALIGGWPFYSAIGLFREWGVPTVALDCGGVPFDDLQGPARAVQECLRALRREYLPEARVVTPISDFIARTQSLPDAGPDVEIRTIHLGSDHLDGTRLWSQRDAASDLGWPAQRQPRIINLGRWEVGNYKNSEALFPLARQILAQHPTACFGVLAPAEDLRIPEDLQQAILPLGHPSDEALASLMASADLGVSLSRWEGFNLPLAEMQQLGRPVLAFDLGAHPEVAADPWQLCQDETEMSDKAQQVLAGQAPPADQWAQAIERFRQRFTWAHTTAAYADLLASLGPLQEPHWPALVIDASACLRDPANTGVARVVRSLSRKLQDFGQPLFVAWDEALQDYVLPTEDEYRNLSGYGGPEIQPRHYLLPRSHPGRRLRLGAVVGQRLRGGWLLQGEIIFERQGPQRRAAARALGLQVAAIFYDAIPVTHPQWVADTAIRDNHAAYMRGLAECDRVLPISPDAAHQLQHYWQRIGLDPDARVQHCWIPGELTGAARNTCLGTLPGPGEPLRLLCVSTLEPRKNHRTLLAAMAQLAARAPQLDWRLDLVGNRYAGGDDIAQSVQQASADDPRITWHGVVDDATLNRLYHSAHVTIYPSLVEGYGMPIVESLWHARPCLCHHAGVMAELAAEGGCLTLDMQDPDALAGAILALAENAALYQQLATQAVSRHILGWRGYARALLTQLAGHHPLRVRALPSHWQHWLLPDALSPVAADPLLALATLLDRQPVRSAVLLGEHPPAVRRLLAARVVQAWQICSAPVERLEPRDGLSCLYAEPEAALPLLQQTLARQGQGIELLICAPDTPLALLGRLCQGRGLLLVPRALAWPGAAIDLGDWQGYRLPCTLPAECAV